MRVAPSDPSELELLEHLDDLVVARSDPDPEGHRRSTRLAVVLPEVDRLAGDLAHVERPEHARDGEPDLALGDDLPGAYAAAVDGAVSELCAPAGGAREERLKTLTPPRTSNGPFPWDSPSSQIPKKGLHH